MVVDNMTLKVYVASISAATDIKKHTQKLLMVLDSRQVPYKLIDIASPGHEADRQFLKSNCKTRPGRTVPLPPQVFNEDVYCGDYEDFENAAEMDELHRFFKLEPLATQQNSATESLIENQLTPDDATTAENLPLDQEGTGVEEYEELIEEESVVKLEKSIDDLEETEVEVEKTASEEVKDEVEEDDIKVESEIIDVSTEEEKVDETEEKAEAGEKEEKAEVTEKNEENADEEPEDVDVEIEEENLADEMVIHEEVEDPGESQLEDVVEEDEENLEEN